MSEPWRDRPDSLVRGYVAGAMAGGWACAALYGVLLLAGAPVSTLVACLFLATALFGTFMWRHG